MFSYQAPIILKPGFSPSWTKTSLTGLGPDAPALSLQQCSSVCLFTTRITNMLVYIPTSQFAGLVHSPATVAPLCTSTCFDWVQSMCEFTGKVRIRGQTAIKKTFWWLFFSVSFWNDKPHKHARFGLTGLFGASCGPVPFLLMESTNFVPVLQLLCFLAHGGSVNLKVSHLCD